MKPKPMLELSSVRKTYRLEGHTITAVAEVSLEIHQGECLAIVGESGSGKSTLANIIVGLTPQTSGTIRWNGANLPARRTLAHRKAIQLVQQNPLGSLNARRPAGAMIRLALDVHKLGTPKERPEKIAELLKVVGLSPACARQAPLTLSGGQCQRIAIARALACESELIVLDEPTSALDVLVQARVLSLLARLRSERKLTYVFISHDLAVVRNVADRVAVMERGRLVESASTRQIFDTPKHPYTRQLISSVPVITASEERLRTKLAGVSA